MAETRARIVPIILAGGKGTRLWPMSRSSRPKQFLNLVGDGSLFQQTLMRIADPDKFAAPIIITNEDYRFVVAEQAHSIGIKPSKILLEPQARNTAPAIIAAALAVNEPEGNQRVFVLPCDHRIDLNEAYEKATDDASLAALNGQLVTFGITPTEPATGFGYIKAGEALSDRVFVVERFTEKPKLSLAEEMYKTEGYFWNSGMFMFTTKSFLDAAKKLAPEVYAAAEGGLRNAVKDLDFVRLDAEIFCQSPSISVDHAIFEHTDQSVVVASPIDWSDLGSWNAVWEVGDRDNDGNLTSDFVNLFNTTGSLVMSDGTNLVIDGLCDVAVISSEDVVYVGRLSDAQNIGSVVEKLRANAETSVFTEYHQTVHRPWGGYTSILNGERYQVKRLFVNPGKSLSLQKHHHRSEHWVVIRGTAEVQIGESVQVLGENKSVYIPLNTVHRLSNPGKILLEVIEVQTGTYLGEDDIIRIEDEFGRN